MSVLRSFGHPRRATLFSWDIRDVRGGGVTAQRGGPEPGRERVEARRAKVDLVGLAAAEQGAAFGRQHGAVRGDQLGAPIAVRQYLNHWVSPLGAGARSGMDTKS